MKIKYIFLNLFNNNFFTFLRGVKDKNSKSLNYLNYIKYGIIYCLIISNILFSQPFPPPREITDEEQIYLIINDLEQGIKTQDLGQIMNCFADPVLVADSTWMTGEQLETEFQTIFNLTDERWSDSTFVELTPPGITSSTWDFEVEVDSVYYTDVYAQIYLLVFYQTVVEEEETDQNALIILQNIEEGWFISSLQNFLYIFYVF